MARTLSPGTLTITFATIVARLELIRQGVVKKTFTLASAGHKYLVKTCWGSPKEEPKVVIRGGLWYVVMKCLIHALPILLCVVVS